MEENKLLPENQHGFRAKRSTMTAWADIQQDWALNTENKEITGVLLWDLSAAFDTYISKMRYGIQLMGKIRWAEDEKMSFDLKAIQTTFNKLARLLCNVTLRDRIPTQTLFGTLGWLSFNQLNAQVKLNEAWKMENIQDYPNKFERKEIPIEGRATRATTNMDVIEPCNSKIGTATFISDAARAWNRTSGSLKNIVSITAAKKEIKKLVKAMVPF